MNDLISRKAAIDTLKNARKLFENVANELLDHSKGNHQECVSRIELINKMVDSFEEILKELPSAEPERKKGKWIQDGHHIQCNQCGISICDKDREGDVLPKKFCPNCGADMRDEEAEEE